MCRLQGEPKLSELLDDPILHLLLERDGIRLEELHRLIERTREACRLAERSPLQ